MPVILLTPPPVDLTRWERFNEQLERFPAYRHNEVVLAYGNAVKRVASHDKDCFVVDVFDLLGGKDLQKFAPYLSDGLHLSSSGNQLVYQGLLDVIQQQCDVIAPDQLEMDQHYASAKEDAMQQQQQLPTSTIQLRRRPSIVLFGDSFTEFGFDNGGWASRLASDYSRRANVLNRGFQGHSTRAILKLLPDMLYPTKPTISSTALFVTVWLGTNDAISEERQVSLDEFESNLKMIVHTIR